MAGLLKRGRIFFLSIAILALVAGCPDPEDSGGTDASSRVYTGQINIEFAGDAGRAISTLTGPTRIRWSNVEEENATPTLDSFEGLLPGLLDDGVADVVVDLRAAPNPTAREDDGVPVTGVVTRFDGSQVDLGQVLGDPRARRDGPAGFVLMFMEEGEVGEYRMQFDTEDPNSFEGNSFVGGVTAELLVMRQGELVQRVGTGRVDGSATDDGPDERDWDACPNDPDKTKPGVCGCGNPDVDNDGDAIVDCVDGCPEDAAKEAPGDCGCGEADVDGDGDGTADCVDGCPEDAAKTEEGICGCGVADVDSDGDGRLDCREGCPEDAAKVEPGQCGCGNPETDGDADGSADCVDECPEDADKTLAGQCGCGQADTDRDGDRTADCLDACPDDPSKQAQGVCGCGNSDIDRDGDGTSDCVDECPDDSAKITAGDCGCGQIEFDGDGDGTSDCIDECPQDPSKALAGSCGCGNPETDGDGDGTPDCVDECPEDGDKAEAGQCGCGVPEIDSDGDGRMDCADGCPDDPAKVAPGRCGCGVADRDSDGDGAPDCLDECPDDPAYIEAGQCGCGVPEIDTDGDGTADCLDGCVDDPDKDEPGVCGCGTPDLDTDGDGMMDCVDNCPEDPGKTEPGVCGCGTADTDTDGDATADCIDGCPEDANKIEPGICGCGLSDADSDGDGLADCNDRCPNDPNKSSPGVCGCGVADVDTDGDATADCIDGCPDDPNKIEPGECGCGAPEIPGCGANEPPVVEEVGYDGGPQVGFYRRVYLGCSANDIDGQVTLVTVDLSAVGGPSNQPLNDDGEGLWSWDGCVFATTAGPATLTFTARDDLGGVGTRDLQLDVAGAPVPLLVQDDFSAFSPNNWTVLGSAGPAAGALRLIGAGQTTEVGGAFYNGYLDGNFILRFTFQVTGVDGSLPDEQGQVDPEGFAVVFTSEYSLSLVGGGAGLGFYQFPYESFALEFDMFDNVNTSDPDSNHLGIDYGGSTESIGTIGVPAAFDGTGRWTVWIQMSSNGSVLTVGVLPPGATSVQCPTDYFRSYKLNAGQAPTQGYLGFTSASGRNSANIDIDDVWLWAPIAD